MQRFEGWMFGPLLALLVVVVVNVGFAVLAVSGGDPIVDSYAAPGR